MLSGKMIEQKLNNIYYVANTMIAFNMYYELDAILKLYAKTAPEFYDRDGFLIINSWLKATESVKDRLYNRSSLVDAEAKLFGDNSEFY